MPIIQRLGSASARGFGFGKTGVTHQRVVQESATITDATNRAVSYDSVISETSTATDAIVSLLNSLNQVLEVATGSDAIQGERGYISVVNETATISDLISTIGNQNITVAEIATATDAVANIGSFDRSVTETGSITDTTQGSILTINNIVEAGTVSDVITPGQTTSGVISEVAIIEDETERLALANGVINETASGADVTAVSVSASYWMAAYYGATTADYQYGVAVCKDANENIYVTGVGVGNGASQAVNVIKYDKDGTIQWQRKLDGGTSQSDVGYAITVDSSNNVYVAGGYNDSGNAAPPGGIRAFIVKLDSSGTVQWQNLFWPSQTSPIQQSNLSTRVYGMVLDSSGNIYTTGVTNLSTNYLFVAKHNSSGVLQWFNRFYSGASRTFGYDIKINSSGNLVVGGSYGYTISSDYRSPLIAVFDTSGNLLSSVRMQDTGTTAGGTRDARIFKIALDASDNIYAAGVIGYGVVSGSDGPILCKFDSSLNLLWATQLHPGTLAVESPAYGVVVDSFGNPYISYFNVASSPDAVVIAKFNTSGAVQWANKLSSNGAVATSIYTPANWLAYSTTNLLQIYSSTISSNTFIGFAQVPLDGTRTGTYSVGPYGQPTTYASFSQTQYTLSWFTQSATFTQFSPVMTVQTATFNNYTTTQTSTTVYI
jgi:hypothetical protein